MAELKKLVWEMNVWWACSYTGNGWGKTLSEDTSKESSKTKKQREQRLKNRIQKKKNPRTYSSCGSVVQWLSHAQLFVFHGLKHARLPCPSASPRVCSLIFTETVILSKHLILCHPLLLHSIFTSMRIFSSESGLPIRWPKYWNSSFSISPSNEYSQLISFMIHWLDLLAVQGTLNSLFQHHHSKASIIQHSAFFMAQLSHFTFL